MQVRYTKRFLKQKDKYKKEKILLNQIDETITCFIEDEKHTSLHFKKINCKKDKNRYSIRVIGSKHRVLMTVFETYSEFFCVCSHNDYDRYNKKC